MNINKYQPQLITFIRSALKEDIGSQDHTTCATIDHTMKGKAHLIMKDNGIIAGIAFAKLLFETYDEHLKFETFFTDGDIVKSGDIIFEIEGQYNAIITAERVMLNCLQRMSGIATATYQLSQSIAHTKTKILDTRKTTPLCRLIEKWAVIIGGGVNHRFGLYDEILVKNNHIDACGGMSNTIAKLAQYVTKHPNIPVVIECRDQQEWSTVLEKAPFVTRILLDNMTPDLIKNAVSVIKRQVKTEASGNINADNIIAYAETGVNFVSMGGLTHSVKSIDMSLHLSFNS